MSMIYKLLLLLSFIWGYSLEVAAQTKQDSMAHLSFDKEDDYGEYCTLNNLAFNYYDIGNLSASKHYLKAAHQYIERLESPNLEYAFCSNYRLLTQIYAEEERLDSALYFAQKALSYIPLSDFELQQAQKEQKITLLELAQQSSNSKLTLQWVLVGVLFFLLILLFIIYRQAIEKNVLLSKDLAREKIIAKELKQIEQLKSTSFANVSHEFRVSLRLILGLLQELNKINIAHTEAKHLTQTIWDNSNHLLDLTDNILDLTKSEFAFLKVDIYRFALDEFINHTIFPFKNLALQKNINLHTPVYLPQQHLVSDPNKLMIVIKNLLFNAFKHTPKDGRITLNCTVSDSRLQIIIADNGHGIHADDLPHLFERYYQAKHTVVSGSGGTGIGLALCKEYTDLLKGTITPTSELGKGSLFAVEVPLEYPNFEGDVIKTYHFDVTEKRLDKDSQSSPAFNQNTTKLGCILVVEDNIELCEYMEIILSPHYNLIFAHNGLEAIAQLANRTPDLIITDLMMPKMDGFGLIDSLKKDDSLRNIPILVLTAKNSLNDKMEIFRLGIDDYLSKPFNEETLLAHILNLLDHSEYQKEEQSDSKAENKPIPIKISRRDEEWLEEFKTTVDNLITDYQLNLDVLAENMNLSVSQLNRKVNALMNISPKRYVKEVRLTKARAMLEKGEYHSVKAVAFAVGFNSEKVFSKSFKVRFGAYPSQYLYAS